MWHLLLQACRSPFRHPSTGTAGLRHCSNTAREKERQTVKHLTRELSVHGRTQASWFTLLHHTGRRFVESKQVLQTPEESKGRKWLKPLSPNTGGSAQQHYGESFALPRDDPPEPRAGCTLLGTPQRVTVAVTSANPIWAKRGGKLRRRREKCRAIPEGNQIPALHTLLRVICNIWYVVHFKCHSYDERERTNGP